MGESHYNIDKQEHETEAEMYCKPDVHNTSLTSFWVLFPHSFEASYGETFKCFLVLQGKIISADIWKGFCKGFSMAGIQNGTRPLVSASSSFECLPGEVSKEKSFAEHTKYLLSVDLITSSLILKWTGTFEK